MTESHSGPTAPSAEALPETLPIFPLGGVLVLPRAELPLHIFEPRYRAMTRDALAGDHTIGMIQPVDPRAEGAQPEIYPVGCAGRITACRKTEDGRYHFTLVGVCRFRVRDELPLKDGYRRIGNGAEVLGGIRPRLLDRSNEAVLSGGEQKLCGGEEELGLERTTGRVAVAEAIGFVALFAVPDVHGDVERTFGQRAIVAAQGPSGGG